MVTYHNYGARVAVAIEGMNVFDAALERIRWLYHEFDGKIAVTSSGGKDSTVTVELAARVAREEGGPPVKVYWLDQEAEYTDTVDYQSYLAYERDDIDFHWYQVPFPLDNSMNLDNLWFRVWDENMGYREDGTGWLRPREDTSIKSLPYVKYDDDFYKVLRKITSIDFAGHAVLGGMRTEESSARRMLVLTNPRYKWATWSVSKEPPRFEPIYDWSYRDVWAAIEKNGWRYNKHYDYMYQWGVPTRSMRVSSFTHTQSLRAIETYLQEVDQDLWERATKRFPGMSTFGHLQQDQYITELPYMFSNWPEYMHYLIDNLIEDEAIRQKFRRQYETMMHEFPDDADENSKVIAKAVVSGDFYETYSKNLRASKARKRL